MNDSSSKKSKSLPPPPIADTINDSKEVLRVWAAPDYPQQFTLHTTWKDPGAWGLLLVDIARHAAKAYKKEGHDENETLNRIKSLFDAEWSAPTDDPKDISTH